LLNTPKVRCTGCTACVAACPKSCLRMERDKEGFFYPVAEEAACINCDRCNRVCPAQRRLPVPKSCCAEDKALKKGINGTY